MMIKPLTRLGLCFTLLFNASSLVAEPLLNGVAESIELNKERFIAALYTSNPSANADDLLRNNGERRMQLKITADRLSAKAINNMWIEGMAINNPSSSLRAESESLSQLVNMVRKSLYRGDTLTFDTQPGAGVTVTLNGVGLGKIPSEDFFSMVLRTWIGNVPLSSEFKKNLLAGGKPNDDLRGRFATLAPTQERIVAVEGWGVPAPPTPQVEPVVAAAAAATIAPPRPRPEITPPRSEITPPRPQIDIPASETIEALRRQDPERVAASLPPQRNGQTLPAGAGNNNSGASAAGNSATPAQQTPIQSPPAQQSSAQVAQAEPTPPIRTAAITPRPAPPQPADDIAEEEEQVVSAASILDRQLYISNVLRQTQKSVEYPERALRREQEGTVRVTVTVDKSGKLLGAIPAEESRYGILNREAIDSFGRAGPFESFPASIKEESISFTIPITFQIPR
jgi:protein TonB